jgi:signal peptidase I
VGDVVVFRRDSDTLVKRVWASSGDKLWEVRDPTVGSFLVATEAELRSLRRTVRNAPGVGTLHQVIVPPGCVYVVGDGGQCSLDSRTFGPIPVKSLSGRVVGVPALAPNAH